MNREAIKDNEIVQFLEYYNQPDCIGIYHKIQEGDYPIYKLNLEEHQLWVLIADFFSTYKIDNKNFCHETFFFRTAIKRNWQVRLKHFMHGTKATGNNMTVGFLTATARRGVWDENNKSMGY